MRRFDQYQVSELIPRDEKQIEMLKDELYNRMNFSERARVSFETIIKCLHDFKGDETYRMCPNSYRNILEYDRTKPEYKIMHRIMKEYGFREPFKHNWKKALIERQQEANNN